MILQAPGGGVLQAPCRGPLGALGPCWPADCCAECPGGCYWPDPTAKRVAMTLSSWALSGTTYCYSGQGDTTNSLLKQSTPGGSQSLVWDATAPGYGDSQCGIGVGPPGLEQGNPPNPYGQGVVFDDVLRVQVTNSQGGVEVFRWRCYALWHHVRCYAGAPTWARFYVVFEEYYPDCPDDIDDEVRDCWRPVRFFLVADRPDLSTAQPWTRTIGGIEFASGTTCPGQFATAPSTKRFVTGPTVPIPWAGTPVPGGDCTGGGNGITAVLSPSGVCSEVVQATVSGQLSCESASQPTFSVAFSFSVSFDFSDYVRCDGTTGGGGGGGNAPAPAPPPDLGDLRDVSRVDDPAVRRVIEQQLVGGGCPGGCGP